MIRYFTSESVTCGHPDKVCDQIADRILDDILTQDSSAHVACEVTCIADRILDDILTQDSSAHVACEVTCAADQVHIFGEISTLAQVDYADAARQVISKIGYTECGCGFDADTCRITVDLHEQSPDIARGVCRKTKEEELDNGAGDQGMMFGFACRETSHYMPLPIELAHALAKRLEYVRRIGELPYLKPDGKTQVTVEYDDLLPKRIDTVVLSAQHSDSIGIDALRNDILNHVILPALPVNMIDERTHFYINPTGRFVLGGPAGDSGLTGRKIIVDTYGGYARHGGGAFSHDILLKTLSRQVGPINVKFSSVMQSGWQSLCPFS